jgi:NTE family protein
LDTTPSSKRHLTSSATSEQPTPRPGRRQVDATERSHAGQRALVLGGGGSTGNAWLIGVVAGLSDAGLDVTTADLTIGTSAGSTAAAQLAGSTPAELFAATVAPIPQRATDPAGSDRARGSTKAVSDHLVRITGLIESSQDAADMRRRMAAAALDMDATWDDSIQQRWRATVAARLPSQDWPERPVLITAVDARTGDAVVFDRDSGIDLVDAVAASCASGFAYAIGSGRYLDGGYRLGAENADLAAGSARVIVLAPFGGRSLTPVAWGMHLATQVDDLRAGGSRVEVIVPTADAEHMFGPNAMDLSLRAPAARAGYDQGATLAERLTESWR